MTPISSRRRIPPMSTCRRRCPVGRRAHGAMCAGSPRGDLRHPCDLGDVAQDENGIDPAYLQFLLTGGTGPTGQPDTRIHYDGRARRTLPPGPFQLTSKTFPYDAYAASPVHRFYPDVAATRLRRDSCHRRSENGVGLPSRPVPLGGGDCRRRFERRGAAGRFNNESTGEGSTSMGFFNVQQGDAPYLKSLADDLYDERQLPSGGQWRHRRQHIMLGTGDAIWFSDGKGNPPLPPNNPSIRHARHAGHGHTSALSEIENPNPQPGTNNFYTAGRLRRWLGCPLRSRRSQLRRRILQRTAPTLPARRRGRPEYPQRVNEVKPSCEEGHYYLSTTTILAISATAPTPTPTPTPTTTVFTIPPSTRSHHRRRASGKQNFLGLFWRPIQPLSQGQIRS